MCLSWVWRALHIKLQRKNSVWNLLQVGPGFKPIPYSLLPRLSFLRGKSLPSSNFVLSFSEEWFADLDYSPEGKLLITKYVPIFVGPGTIKQTSIPLIFNITCRKHDPLSLEEVESRVSTNRTFRASRRADSDNEKKNNNLRWSGCFLMG